MGGRSLKEEGTKEKDEGSFMKDEGIRYGNILNRRGIRKIILYERGKLRIPDGRQEIVVRN